jgi:imidazolonepropionase-like amidohydrolase
VRAQRGAWLVTLVLAAWTAGAETVVVDADVVHPVGAAPIANGRVVVEDGRIAAVGPAASTAAPAEARRLRAAVATPGFVDPHSSVGLAGMYNVPADRDEDERSGPNQAGVRALDAFNPNEPLLRHQLEHGVVLVQSSPGPANAVAGQAGLFRTHGDTADAMALRPVSALVFNLGEAPKETYSEKKTAPLTRMGTAALLREALLSGREYAAGRARAERGAGGTTPDRDLGREALARAAAGDLPAIFVAHRADDIVTALRIAREYNLRFALAGATEGYLVADAIRDAGAPVLVGPVMERVGSPETRNASYENAARLARAGIRIAIRSGYEDYVPRTRLVLWEAAVAAVNGLGFDAALHAISLGAAEVLGVDDRFGSLEAGKSGDVVLFDGDPFEYTSHVTAVVAGGEVVFERPAP